MNEYLNKIYLFKVYFMVKLIEVLIRGVFMTRREARIMAMQILYTSDLNNISINDAIKFYDETVVEQDTIIFVENVVNNLEKIDDIISKSLVNYTINRLNLVDKAIVRLATSELLFGTDKRIVINEALEITKEFSDQGDHKATSFNNRLLERICKTIEELK